MFPLELPAINGITKRPTVYLRLTATSIFRTMILLLPMMQDRATLRSDLSGTRGFAGVWCHVGIAPFAFSAGRFIRHSTNTPSNSRFVIPTRSKDGAGRITPLENCLTMSYPTPCARAARLSRSPSPTINLYTFFHLLSVADCTRRGLYFTWGGSILSVKFSRFNVSEP